MGEWEIGEGPYGADGLRGLPAPGRANLPAPGLVGEGEQKPRNLGSAGPDPKLAIL